ncbi:MAG: TolC family protein [Lachnospiraceae bacterium]|nr:TolC family protein [Lachnospiraceae bacterium]
MKQGGLKKLIILFLGAVFFGFSLKTAAAPPIGPLRVGGVLTMAAARALAVEESTAYFQVEQQIASKEAALKSAQKAIKLKQKSMSTFRWSPLLSFKFPTKPTEAEALEFQFKPVSIQAEIDEAKHKLTDTKLGIYEEINKLYVDIVVLQRTIDFSKKRIDAYKLGLEKNRARLLIGEATQADVDGLEKKLDAAESKLATDQRTLEADLRKLSDKIGTDVTTNYRFETPFLEASIPRTALPALIQYTLDRDQTYYKACLDETTARAELKMNDSLFRNHYGSEYGMISSYVTMALNGEKIKGSLAKGFKKDYDAFIKQIDSHWEGKKRILFIKIPRLWFKGSLDGTRYIDDDPYVCYQATLDYVSAVTDKEAAEGDLEEQVIDSFENYISTRNAYAKMAEDLETSEANLEADLLRNQLGELSFEEYDSAMSDYEQLQNDFFEQMKTYSETLYAFDRLTCGGVTAFISGTDASLETGETGTSYVEKDMADGASYFLKQIIQNEAFELSVYIPEDFEVDITDFELWCDNTRIGEKTPIDKRLRHLALTKSGVSKVKIRLYNGEEFVDDVVIDPQESSGPLPIVKDRRIVKKEDGEIGLVDLSTSSVTGLLTIKLEITEDPAVASYKVKTSDGKYISGEKPIKNGKSFKHLALVEDGLGDCEIELYGKDDNLLYNARFDMKNRKIKKVTE